MGEKKKVKISIGEFLIIIAIIILAIIILGNMIVLKKQYSIEIANNNEKIEMLEKETKNEKEVNTISEEKKDSSEEVISIDEAYGIVEKLNPIAQQISIGNTTSEMQVDGKRIINYDAIMNKYFTSNGRKIADDKLAIEQKGKEYYSESPSSSVIGLDYITTAFIKMEVTKDTISCVADNMFYKKFDSDTEYYLMPEIEHKEKKLVIKKENGTWKLDEFYAPRS